MNKKFDQHHAESNGYTQADWDAVDSPELTDEEIKAAVPFQEAFPEAARKMRRGRPRSANPKVPVSFRLDSDLVDVLRASGEGWQSRVNEALRKAFL
ncbi:MAG: BrnA antitoxin family protein [Pseudomonadota bacterium]